MIAWLASWPHELAVAWTVGSSTILGALVLVAEHRDNKRRTTRRRVFHRPPSSSSTRKRAREVGGIQ